MSAWRPASSDVEWATEKTGLMRTGQEPPWPEVREHLVALGLSTERVVLSSWEMEGAHLMGGMIATEDGRVFNLMVVYGYDRSGREVPEEVGYVSGFREIDPQKLNVTSAGEPNSWLQAVLIARVVLGSNG